MKLLRRGLLGLLALVIILALVLGQTGFWLAWRAWPQITGTLNVAGINEQVEIIRDKWGVPHIYAQNEHDLFFAQGYVHAQDRLWQMEFNRRIGSGTTSAVLGTATLRIDRLTRTMQLRRAAEQDLAILDEESRVILQAYADGVNAYIEDHRGRLGVEFTVLGIDPAPWTPLDTLTWGKVMALNLSWNYTLELLRARMLAGMEVDTVRQLMPPFADGPALNIPPEAGDYRWLKQATSQVNPLSGLLQHDYYLQGSNNWVVGGARSASGRPMLANDTHLDLSMPSIWYLNGLHGGRFNSVGYTFPGVPLVIIGHNDRIAWGVTDLPADVQDLYIEKLDDPANPTKYEYQGQWYDLTIDRQTIEVKGQAPVTLEVRSTRHGPIINETDTALKQAEPLAVRWTALAGTNLFRGVVGLNLAQDWPAFLRALQFWDAPSQHFVYADVDGNIGYQSAGLMPLRAPGHDGLLPVPGWTGTYEWQEIVGTDKLYSVLNPPNHFFTTANDRLVPADHPYQAAYGNDWASANYNVERISQALEAGNGFSLDDMTNLQVDNTSIPATRLLPYLLAIEPENELQERVHTILRGWNQRFERDEVGATIYRAWYLYMMRYTFNDSITEGLGSRYEGVGWLSAPVMLSIIDQPDNQWFDDVGTPEREGRDDIARRSLVDALTLLQQQYGENPDQWTWGRMHRVNLRAQPLGQTGVSLVDNIFNSGFMPADGGDFTVNNSWLNGRTPFQVAGGPAQRFVIDVGNWDASRAANSTGQSEHLFHPHRTDIVQLWINSQYHPMLFSRAAVESHQESVLLIAPQR